jgi:hypothetical protein
MIVQVVDRETGRTLLTESEWNQELPRIGDVLEIHCGPAERYVVEEVDWVFEHVPAERREEVPLHFLRVLVSPEEKAKTRPAFATAVVTTAEGDPFCQCGHRKSWHTPMRCIGDAGRCTCSGFTAAVDTPA